MSKLKGKSPELVKPGKIKAVLYGPSGVGKTTLALSFPSPYYFDVEGGAKGEQYRKLLKDAGGAYLGPEDGTLSFDFLIDQMQALATEKHGYKTLIIDSLTKLFQTAVANENERILAAGKKDEFGASKKPAVAAMRRVVNWASKLDLNIWFVCHETAKWVEINGERAQQGTQEDAWEKLRYELDLCVSATKRGPQRLAKVEKSRLLGFPEGDTFPLAYAEFAARHGKEIVEATAETIVLAKPDQINEVHKLLDLVKGITPETIDKWFTAAGATKWEELSEKQIDGVITHLKKKLSV